ncbi:MAG: QueT transporter family protein [Lachnospiraceae bacterium]|nr:QueT transporter family protein [Lachnospiraceae bacterium]
MSHEKILYIAQGAVIAAVYVVLTLLFAPISFGTSGIDVRIAEALTILPVFTPAAVPGVFIGCLLANILGGGIIWDIIFGSLASLIGAIGCRMLRSKRHLAPLPTVLANAIIVPLVLRFGYGVNMPFLMLVLSVGAGEFLSAYCLGQVLYTALKPVSKYLQAEAH